MTKPKEFDYQDAWKKQQEGKPCPGLAGNSFAKASEPASVKLSPEMERTLAIHHGHAPVSSRDWAPNTREQ